MRINKQDGEKCMMCDSLTSPRGIYGEGWNAICSRFCFDNYLRESNGE